MSNLNKKSQLKLVKIVNDVGNEGLHYIQNKKSPQI